jgi:hypothetical protein
MVLAKKEEASAKRDGRRRPEKEEKMISSADIQRNTLEVQELKLELTKGKRRSREKDDQRPRKISSKQKKLRSHCSPRRAGS